MVERRTEKPGAIRTRVRFPDVAKDLFSFSSQISVHTFLQCSYSPRVQSHAATSVRTLTIPDTGICTIVWTHENTAHTVMNR